MVGDRLINTTDAMVWADEFVRIFSGQVISDENEAVNVGLMVAWFANAIETGRNFGRKETCPHDECFPISDDTLCCRDCGSLLQGEKITLTVDLEAEQESFMEGFNEGRG